MLVFGMTVDAVYRSIDDQIQGLQAIKNAEDVLITQMGYTSKGMQDNLASIESNLKKIQVILLGRLPPEPENIQLYNECLYVVSVFRSKLENILNENMKEIKQRDILLGIHAFHLKSPENNTTYELAEEYANNLLINEVILKLFDAEKNLNHRNAVRECFARIAISGTHKDSYVQRPRSEDLNAFVDVLGKEISNISKLEEKLQEIQRGWIPV